MVVRNDNCVPLASLTNDQSSSQNIDQIQSVMGVASALASIAAPAIAVIGLSTMFIKWITRTYQRTYAHFSRFIIRAHILTYKQLLFIVPRYCAVLWATLWT